MVSFQRFPYPEYHTSDDNLKCISDKSLEETYEKVMGLIKSLEANYTPIRLRQDQYIYQNMDYMMRYQHQEINIGLTGV